MGTLLKSTCNTFLKTLEECMQIANAAFTSELLCRTPPGSPQLAVLKSGKVRGRLSLAGAGLTTSGKVSCVLHHPLVTDRDCLQWTSHYVHSYLCPQSPTSGQ